MGRKNSTAGRVFIAVSYYMLVTANGGLGARLEELYEAGAR